jgi:hypothetical protein
MIDRDQDLLGHGLGHGARGGAQDLRAAGCGNLDRAHGVGHCGPLRCRLAYGMPGPGTFGKGVG